MDHAWMLNIHSAVVHFVLFMHILLDFQVFPSCLVRRESNHCLTTHARPIYKVHISVQMYNCVCIFKHKASVRTQTSQSICQHAWGIIIQLTADRCWNILIDLFFLLLWTASIRRKTAKGCLNTDERLNISDENVSAPCDYGYDFTDRLVWHQSVIEASIHPSIECLTVLEQPDDCPTLTVSKLCDDQAK